MSALPNVTRLYLDYLERSTLPDAAPVRSWYGAEQTPTGWAGHAAGVAHREELADLLVAQNVGWGAGPAALENIEKLRSGARAVVTGQQVGLLGGPLLTLLKAATAVARAAEATRVSGVEHVPIFWLATEDHDLEEVDQISLLSKKQVETLRLGLASTGGEVGAVVLGDGILPLLEEVSELLGYAPVCDLLAECYRAEVTLSAAFGRLMATLFAGHGLVVIDASGREFHRLGAPALRAAIEHAEQLEDLLLARTEELEKAGYHAQVLVKPGASLLFLIDENGRRVPLRRPAGPDARWKAGTRSLTTGELLTVLEETPERVSPNALLRPVFQDVLLPTTSYVGGPAEIAYFAQSAVLYEKILGRVTTVLPRFSATLIEPAIAALMARHEVSLSQVFTAGTADEMTLRLGARAMPIEGKRKLAAAGNAMDAELTALTSYMGQMDESLGRSAAVSASKMRYQMNRLRRMAAAFEVEKETSLRKHSDALMLHLWPKGHAQERVIGGVWFLAQTEGLVDRLVQEAAEMCVGHSVLYL